MAAGTIAALLLAMAARACLQFGSPLAPGMNGAYYFVQARALLEQGKLGIPDLPLTFWLQAALARVIQAFTGWDQAHAIVFAVKAADSVLPPLAALPLVWLGWRWQRGTGRPSAMAALAPAVAAVLGGQALRMTGDFQKNSLGLIWLSALAPAAHAFLTQPNWRRALLPLALLALLGITHVGVLGGALVFTAVLAVTSLVSAPAAVRRRVLLFTLAGLVVLALSAAVTRAFDPGRFHRLTQAIKSPSSFAENRGGPGGAGFHRGGPPPIQADQDADDDQLDAFGPPETAPHAGAGPGHPPDGQGGFGLPFAPGWLFLGLGAAGTGVALWKRRTLPAPDFALAAAAAITCGLLGGPFFDEQKAERLMLIAVIPAAMTASFLLARLNGAWLRRGLGVVVIGAAAFTAWDYVRTGAHAIISVEAQAELQTLTPLVPNPEHTLIVAHHGLEWWTAWTLHTHIAQPSAVSAEDWQRYDRVLYLTEKPGADFHQGPPGARLAGRPPGPPPGGGFPDRGFPGGGFPGGGPGDAEVPTGAQTLHEGKCFTLSLVTTAPENAATDSEVAARRLNRP